MTINVYPLGPTRKGWVMIVLPDGHAVDLSPSQSLRLLVLLQKELDAQKATPNPDRTPTR